MLLNNYFLTNKKMKRIFLLLLLSFALQSGTAQNIYFPKSNYADSTSLAKHLPVLANKIIEIYKAENREDYLDDSYRLQFVAQKYKAMQTTLNTYGQEIYGDSIKHKEVDLGRF